MRWFKHLADADSDGWLNRLENELGIEAYARWWKLLETIALQMNESERCAATYRPGFWTRRLRFRSVPDCQKFLVRLAVDGRILFTGDQRSISDQSPNDRRSFPECSANEWSIKCPKLLKIRARRNATGPKIEDIDKEEERDASFSLLPEEKKPPSDVEEVFQAYRDSWKKLPTYELTPQRKTWIQNAIRVHGKSGALRGIKAFRADNWPLRAKNNDLKYLFGSRDKIDKWCSAETPTDNLFPTKPYWQEAS